MTTTPDVAGLCRRARAAARLAPRHSPDDRTRGLSLAASAVRDGAGRILDANRLDVDAARSVGTPDYTIDRLRLDHGRIAALAAAVEEVAALADPVGSELASWTRPNGLRIRKVRVPLGVVAVVYEARPNVTAEAAALCVRSGNAAVLRGSRSALATNRVLAALVRDGLAGAGLPADLVCLLEDEGQEGVGALLSGPGLADVVVPRGGAGLIRYVRENARVPVLETGVGNCHVYLHADAPPEMAAAIVVNAKASRPSVCNAAETLLAHRLFAGRHLSRVAGALREAGVVCRGCERARALVPWMEPATPEDFDAEFLAPVIAVAVVDGLDDAIAHIGRHGTGHSEAIVTSDPDAAAVFLRLVDAAVVYHNASTRFTDGGEFGFGAEIGISTQKFHARGPMGVAELTSYKFLVSGEGQIR